MHGDLLRRGRAALRVATTNGEGTRAAVPVEIAARGRLERRTVRSVPAIEGKGVGVWLVGSERQQTPRRVFPRARWVHHHFAARYRGGRERRGRRIGRLHWTARSDQRCPCGNEREAVERLREARRAKVSHE